MLTRNCARAALTALVAVAGGCGSDSVAPGNTLKLSAQQAAAIKSRMELIATLQGELGWLSDSANLVIAAGRQVGRITANIDGTEANYFAVGLHREIVFSPANGFATFHLLAFDNPDDPRNFVIANGYVQQTGASMPTSVTGSFGGIDVFAHLVQYDGVVTGWQATQGTATFTSAVTSEACPGVSLPSIMTCRVSTLQATFSINTTGPPMQPLTSTRSASLAIVTVPAITIRIINELP